MNSIIDIIQIIDAIPKILQYFVSGYLFIILFVAVTTKKIDSSIRFIFSCIISFIWIALINAIFTNIDIWLIVIISCALSLIFAPVFGRIYISKWFCSILVKFFNQSSLNSIWQKVINYENGTNLKVYLKNQPFYFIGHYDAHEKTENDPWFSVKGYIKYDIETDDVISDYRGHEEIFIVFNLSEVATIEVFT